MLTCPVNDTFSGLHDQNDDAIHSKSNHVPCEIHSKVQYLNWQMSCSAGKHFNRTTHAPCCLLSFCLLSAVQLQVRTWTALHCSGKCKSWRNEISGKKVSCSPNVLRQEIERETVRQVIRSLHSSDLPSRWRSWRMADSSKWSRLHTSNLSAGEYQVKFLFKRPHRSFSTSD